MIFICHKHRTPLLSTEINRLSGKYELRLDTDNYSLSDIVPELEETVAMLRERVVCLKSGEKND